MNMLRKQTMAKVTKIRKRDMSITRFNRQKISDAIFKTTQALNKPDRILADSIASEVEAQLNRQYAGRIPCVEDIQEIVEYYLIRGGNADIAKSYILYRQKHKEIRQIKGFFGVTDTLKLSINAIKVLEARYLLKDENRQVIETPQQMFRRVAGCVAAADRLYDKKADIKDTEKRFYQMMAGLEFLPNSPTLMNAGTSLRQLSACFVLPVDDSIEQIFETVKNCAIIHKSGGGTGFSFSRIRPRGDIVMSTKGMASGPVSFMRIIDTATGVIKQGGKRKGANIGILSVDHPDIIEFIESKSGQGLLNNFNISIAATDRFMRAVKSSSSYYLINPRTGKRTGKANAGDIFNLLAANAWKSADPGMIFIDTINRHNPTPSLDRIESTNPCGELPLLAYESCNLGSINILKVVNNKKIDWEKLRYLVHNGVHFLDNVIDATRFPLKEIERITKANRKIGLGVMGFADMLIKLGIRYDSPKALKTAGQVMRFIYHEAKIKSMDLASARGSFPNFNKSIWKKKYKKMRNASVIAIAPTGTLSIIAGCSSSIEPVFAVSYVRNILEGSRLIESNSLFEETAKQKGFYSDELMIKIAKTGSINGIKRIPASVRNLFVTAHDISPEYHVRMQAAFQKRCDNSISKTINLPASATVEDVRNIFMLAYDLKCKGITVYRYGCRDEQALSLGASVVPDISCPKCSPP